jgi:hypothetical protein
MTRLILAARCTGPALRCDRPSGRKKWPPSRLAKTLAIVGIAMLRPQTANAQQAMTDQLRNVVLYNAPYIIAETLQNVQDYSGHVPPSAIDHLLAVDFDNDALGSNNSQHAFTSFIPQRIPTVYYSIEETNAVDGTGYYYIGYYFYHPNDGGTFISGGHEHDMEGVFLIVRKVTWNPYGIPVLAWSEAHGALIPYFQQGSVDPNTALSQGDETAWGGQINMRLDQDFNTNRPVVAIRQSDHGTYMAQQCGPYAAGIYVNGYGYDVGTGGSNTFGACLHGGTSFILYQPAADSYPFVGLGDYENHNTYNYRLRELATSIVWQNRSTSSGLFSGQSLGLGYGLYGGEFFLPSSGTGDANPPWAWLGGAGDHAGCCGYAGYWYNFGMDNTSDTQGTPQPWPAIAQGELLIAPQTAAYRFFQNYNGFSEPVVFNAFHSQNPPPPPPELTVSVSGPDVVWTGHYASWSAQVTSGTAPYTYQWSGANMGTSTQDSFNGYVYYPFTLYLDVWDASGAHVAVTKDIATCDSGWTDC